MSCVICRGGAVLGALLLGSGVSAANAAITEPTFFMIDDVQGFLVEFDAVTRQAVFPPVQLDRAGTYTNLVYNPNTGSLFSSSNGFLVEIDPVTGTTALRSGGGTNALSQFTDTGGMAFDSLTGDLLSIKASSGLLRRVDPTTGAVSSLGSMHVGFAAPDSFNGLAFDPSTNTAYTTGYVPVESELKHALLAFNLSTGARTILPGLDDGALIRGLTFDTESGTLWGFLNDGTPSLVSIDTTTGVASYTGFLAGPNIFLTPGLHSLAFAVPAPSSAALLALGGFVVSRRRRGASFC